MDKPGKPVVLKFLPEKWQWYRRLFPDLFDRKELRRNIKADEVLATITRAEIGKSLGYILSSLVVDFADHFASADDVGRIRDKLTAFGIDPMAWAATEGDGLANGARRFGDGEVFLRKIEEDVLDPADHDEVSKFREWMVMKERRPPLAVHLWGSQSLKRKNITKLAELLLRLPRSVREDALAIVDYAGLAKLLVLPDMVNEWLEVLTEDLGMFFIDPLETLRSAADLDDEVRDKEWFARVYLPAYTFAMADPYRLVALFAKLPRGEGLIAPPMGSSDEWPELGDFMELHGLNRNTFTAWYATVRRCEPEMVQHIHIALSSRLRTSFTDVWTTMRREQKPGERNPYYREFLNTVSSKTGLAVGELDAWLTWRYIMPQVEGEFKHLESKRYQALRDSKRFGTFLREHTMMLDRAFDQMRGLSQRVPEPQTEWDRIKAVLKTARNHFATYHTKDDKKGKVVEALAELDLSPFDVWRRLDGWREGGADASTLAYIEMVFTQLGFKKPDSFRRVKFSRPDPTPTPLPESKVREAIEERTEVKPVSTGHRVSIAPRRRRLGAKLDVLSNIIESPEDYFDEDDYERFSTWADRLEDLISRGSHPVEGVRMLGNELRTALQRKGLDLDALVNAASKKVGDGEGSGSSPAGNAPPSTPSSPPASSPPITPDYFMPLGGSVQPTLFHTITPVQPL